MDQCLKNKPLRGILLEDTSLLLLNVRYNSHYQSLVRQKAIQWECHVDTKTLRRNAQYDMIIGADLLSESRIEINYNTQPRIWEGIEIPMKDKHVISDIRNATAIYHQSIKPTVHKEAEARQNAL